MVGARESGRWVDRRHCSRSVQQDTRDRDGVGWLCREIPPRPCLLGECHQDLPLPNKGETSYEMLVDYQAMGGQVEWFGRRY